MTVFNLQNNEYNSEEISELYEEITRLVELNKYDHAGKLIADLHPADFADYLNFSNDKLIKKILHHYGDFIKPETLVWANPNAKVQIYQIIGATNTARLIEELDTEDAIEVIEEFNHVRNTEIINNISSVKKSRILEGFTYPENTVGRIMERKFISFPDYFLVEDAVKHIQDSQINQDIHAAIVTDKKNRPVGCIFMCRLLQNPSNVPIKYLMATEFKLSDTETTLDELSYVYKQYALTIVPVVNKLGKLIGSVSIDNMLYIIDQQNEDELLSLGGVYKQDTFSSIIFTIKHRLPWLIMNLITAIVTSLVVMNYTDIIHKFVLLAAAMPVVMIMGGNAATQVMTVTVRALSTKELTDNNALKIIIKEIVVSLTMGLCLALVSGGMYYLISHDMAITLIFATAIIINFFIAGLAGVIIPIAFNNIKVDPALASGVCVTFFTDALGVFIFLGLSYLVLF